MPRLGVAAGTAFRIDVLSQRPAAEPALEGYHFFATDVNGGTLYECDGATWVQLTAGLRSIVAGTNINVVQDSSTITIGSTSSYVLPIASSTVLGGIKVGSGLTIDAGGVLNNAFVLPIASGSTLGGIKVGANLSIDGAGVLSGASPYTLPTASASVLGGVKVGTGLAIDGSGILSTTVNPIDVLTFVISGGGATIPTGIVGDLVCFYGCTINQVTMLADQTTNAVVDIWKSAYAGYPPTVTNKITASAPPTITATNKSQDSTLTGWTTSISAGDILRFNVNSCSAAQIITITLKVTRS